MLPFIYMTIFKEYIKSKFPGLVSFIAQLINQVRGAPLRFKSPKVVFNEIYRKNAWGSPESLSGPGSNIQQTKTIIVELPKIMREFGANSMLDIPCGDFYWMRKVDIGELQYIGADIVEELIISNNTKFAKQGREFIVLDILKNQMPTVDLIFCRDCFVHFSFRDIKLAVANIKNSGSKYLVTTTFMRSDRNIDIATGQWRPINLQLFPFYFPEPIKIINENCTWGNNAYSDKSLGVWKISELAF